MEVIVNESGELRLEPVKEIEPGACVECSSLTPILKHILAHLSDANQHETTNDMIVKHTGFKQRLTWHFECDYCNYKTFYHDEILRHADIKHNVFLGKPGKSHQKHHRTNSSVKKRPQPTRFQASSPIAKLAKVTPGVSSNTNMVVKLDRIPDPSATQSNGATSADGTSAVETSTGDTSTGDRVVADTLASETLVVEALVSETSAIDTLVSVTPTVDALVSVTPTVDALAGETPTVDALVGETSVAGAYAGKISVAGAYAGEISVADALGSEASIGEVPSSGDEADTIDEFTKTLDSQEIQDSKLGEIGGGLSKYDTVKVPYPHRSDFNQVVKDFLDEKGYWNACMHIEDIPQNHLDEIIIKIQKFHPVFTDNAIYQDIKRKLKNKRYDTLKRRPKTRKRSVGKPKSQRAFRYTVNLGLT